MRIWFKNVLIFFSLIKWISSNIYNKNILQTGVWLSGAAYCNKENYKTMEIGGPASGFMYKDTLYDIKTDIQGYIGIISTKTIYIVLRGSSSAINWLDDFEVNQVPYDTYIECNCKVHNGFYKSALSIKNKTISSIRFLQKMYPSYSIVVTGHSYGAAVGQLLAMELEKENIKVKIYNYGQPRVGDAKYANFINTVIKEYWRTTHDKDIVPHVPPIEGLGYLHSCREIFEDSTGKLNICSEDNCEDPNCANQYKLYQTNTNDHEVYLQHNVSCIDSII